MTDKEVNKIIAEYMGEKQAHFDCSCITANQFSDTNIWCPKSKTYGYGRTFRKYTTSLDALVPVWEKLQDHGLEVLLTTSKVSSESSVMIWKTHQDDCCGCYERVQEDELGSSVEGTVQQAAAHATAKAIKELK